MKEISRKENKKKVIKTNRRIKVRYRYQLYAYTE